MLPATLAESNCFPDAGVRLYRQPWIHETVSGVLCGARTTVMAFSEHHAGADKHAAAAGIDLVAGAVFGLCRK